MADSERHKQPDQSQSLFDSLKKFWAKRKDRLYTETWSEPFIDIEGTLYYKQENTVYMTFAVDRSAQWVSECTELRF